ncbi:MAG: DUF3120 domain-containing protein [Cyanobacteriota bacterium]|nr:DUF3120 domain-containing protein [Cyanobacteriota bacterium]
MLGALPTLLTEPRPAPLALVAREAPREAAADWFLLRTAALLVTLPVFVQAPLVHAQPLLAALLTAPLLTAGIVLGLSEQPRRARLGALLVGFAGSWLCGSLFWGWCRLHPLWHLPMEALALPLALGGLRSRWRWAGAFYLASLLGTAATDAAMALTGVMPLWPLVLGAPPEAAMQLLQAAASQVLTPLNLGLIAAFAAGLGALGTWLWQRQSLGRVAAITVLTTLGVDGIFLLLALGAPSWSGLI